VAVCGGRARAAEGGEGVQIHTRRAAEEPTALLGRAVLARVGGGGIRGRSRGAAAFTPVRSRGAAHRHRRAGAAGARAVRSYGARRAEVTQGADADTGVRGAGAGADGGGRAGAAAGRGPAVALRAGQAVV